MKISNRLVTGVVAVLILAALVFALRSCGSGSSDGAPKPTTAATPDKPKIPTTSTGYIVTRIKGRLESITGRPVKVVCPATIELVKGTKITCKVYYSDKNPKTQVAKAIVTMKDRTGVFVWKSYPV